MKNVIGFIPKSAPVQPDYYSKIFNNWNAVFIVDDGSVMGTEYHIELVSNGFFHPELVDHIEILKQTPTCRKRICAENFKSIKQAYLHLLPLLKQNEVTI